MKTNAPIAMLFAAAALTVTHPAYSKEESGKQDSVVKKNVGSMVGKVPGPKAKAAVLEQGKKTGWNTGLKPPDTAPRRPAPAPRTAGQIPLARGAEAPANALVKSNPPGTDGESVTKPKVKVASDEAVVNGQLE